MPTSCDRGLDPLGRQPAPVHVRLHLRRDVVRAVPVGLPDDRDRGRPDAARRCSPHERRRRFWWAGAGALLVTWLQPWQGATLALVVVVVEGLRWRRGQRPAVAALVTPAAIVPPTLYYLLLSRLDAGLGARGQVERRGRDARVELAVVGDRAHARAAGRPGRAGLPAAGALVAGDRGARLAARRARRLPGAGRHVPLPRVPGARDPALHPRRPGSAHGLAAPRAARRGGPHRAHERARASRTSSRSRSTRSARPATRSGSSRTSTARCDSSSTIRGPAASSARSTPATCCPTRPAARPGSAR